MPILNDILYIEKAPVQKGAGAPPLLVLLHGVGSDEADLMSMAPELDPRFHVVSLRAPRIWSYGGFGWFHFDFGADGLQVDPAEIEASRTHLVELIPQLVGATGIDPRRVYLAGFSQGAMMSLIVALTRPDLIAGVVAMSGSMVPPLAWEHASREALDALPILLTHGTFDPVLPVALGRFTRQFLSTLPVDLTYHEYPMGHQVSRESLDDVASWLTSHLDRNTDQS